MSDRLVRIQDWEALAKEAKFRPEAMAALCPTSLRTLERFFADNFNKTPGEWARHARCRMARQLISEGWCNKAVVEALHFGNQSHLCHEFKRVYGVSPQRFAPLYGKGSSRQPVIEGVAFRQECRV